MNSIRARTVVAVALLILAALIAGIFVTTSIVRGSLERGVRSSVRARADDLSALLTGGTRPSSLAITDQEDVFVKVSTPSGRVVAETRNARRLPASRTFRTDRPSTVTGLIGETHDRFSVLSVPVRTPTGRYVISVGRNLDTVGETVHVLTRSLIAGSALLFLLVVGGSWLLMKRALSPVERMRRAAATISATDLDRRLPVPAGRDEIARLAITLNEMLMRIADAQARERRFLSDASHELRSPVAAIRQHAEVSLAQDGRGEISRDVLDATLRLEYLIDDLFTIARLREQGSVERFEAIDLDDIVLDELQGLFPQGIAIDAKGVSAARCFADASQMRSLVRNLMDNAVRHASHEVALRLVEDSHFAVLTVEDDGPGISVKDRSAVFERFTRLDSSRDRRGGGAGLGLAIVAGIVEVHGGSVKVDESGLGGARFVVKIPASND